MATMDIPDPDYDDPKEVFAFFGLAFYMAQVLEQALANFAVALLARGKASVTAGEVRSLYDGFDKHTFGRMLLATRKIVPIEDALAADLERALEKRNYLAHAYFKIHDMDQLTEQGRRRMVDELRELVVLFQSVDVHFHPVWMKAWDVLGVSEEWWNEQCEKMKALALEKEGQGK